MSELDKIRAEIRAITAETLEYMRILHAEKMATLDELEAWLLANERRYRRRVTAIQEGRSPRERRRQ